MTVSPAIQRCRAEQLRCVEALKTETNPLERAGLRMGIEDWLSEEIELMALEADGIQGELANG